MKKTLNLKIAAVVLMAIIALAALGLVLGLVLGDRVAYAADENAGAESGETADQPASEEEPGKDIGLIAVAAAIAVGVAAAAGAIGMGIVVAKSNESIARQPEVKGDIRSSMMLGLVFIETAIIYALIVAILVIFVDWQQILLHLLNFLILFAGLYFILYKPVKKFMKKRADGYAERESRTKEALEDAERSRDAYSAKLAEADAEIAALKKQAEADAEEQCAAKIARAEEAAAKLAEDAAAKAAKEHDRIIKKAQGDIRDIVGEIAAKAAVGEDIDKVYDKFLSAAEKGNDED